MRRRALSKGRLELAQINRDMSGRNSEGPSGTPCCEYLPERLTQWAIDSKVRVVQRFQSISQGEEIDGGSSLSWTSGPSDGHICGLKVGKATYLGLYVQAIGLQLAAWA